MKKAVFLLSVLCALMLCLPAHAVLRTSVGTGLWSAAGTWDTGVPVDTDTFLIAAGHTVTFDVDQSAFVGLGASTIAATGKLIASTTAGTYVLKMNGNLTVTGTLQAGTSRAVPYPSTAKFTIEFVGARQILGAGVLSLYCTEPTYKYITTTGALAAGVDTVIPVDTDVTGDIWADGDYIAVIDATTAKDIEREQIAVGGIAANQITITAAITNAKASGSKVALITRNIRIINSTTYAIYSIKNSTIDVELYNNANNFYVLQDSYTGGCAYGGNYHQIGSGGCISDMVLLNASTAGFSTSYAIIQNALMACNNDSFLTCNSVVSTGLIFSASSGFNGCGGASSSGELAYCTDGFLRCSSIISSCTFTACTDDLDTCSGGSFYNTEFGTGTEFTGYNTYRRSRFDYLESTNHDTVVNAHKAWCRGGIVTSQTTSPPTGYTIFYRHAVENASYPVFRQYEATVQSHTDIEVDAVIRNTDGINVSATSPVDLRPRLEIIDVFNDPLVDSTATPLDTVALPVSDGTNTDWQEVKGIWANTADSPKQVYVRIITYSHDTSNHNIDEAWAVADYQDQIAALYNSLIPIRTEVATADTTTSFTLTDGQAATNAYRYNTIAIQDATDAHWEQRKILNWTSGRVVTTDHAFSFTPAVGDQAHILSAGYGEDDLIIAGTVPDATSTANSIKLGANASSTNDIYNENLIVLTGGTGAGQARLITDYFGATKRAAVRNPWVITPDATTTYRIAPFSGILLANTGLCNGGTVNSITLRTPAPATADLYNGHTIFLSGGTGMGQARLITDYSAALVATVTPNWDITPVVDDTVYIVLPVGLGTIYSDITAIKAVTDIMEAVNSTVSVVGDANSFTIANTGDINDVNDAYNGMTVYVEDATTGDWEARLVDNWETGRVITVDADFTFTPEVGDIVIIWGTSYFPISVYNGLPLPPEGETITVDRRVAPTGGTIGGTRTLDAEGDDPPR